MHRYRRLCPLLAVACLSLGGCGVAANKKAAEATATQFYRALAKQDWDAVLRLHSAEFYQNTNREQWRDMLVGLHDKLGDYKHHELTNWSSQSFTGTGGSRQTTVLTYQVQYAKGEATEALTFLAGGDEKALKISGYHINSPLLLQPAAAAKPSEAEPSEARSSDVKPTDTKASDAKPSDPAEPSQPTDP